MNQSMTVSVIMLTYNDEKFIVETLESIKAQTYNNIELVISDDKSKDNTVSVATAWVEKNRSRFSNVVILQSIENVGVTANAIRALNACSGQWFKGIGGDNLMKPEAIEKFVDYVNQNPQASVVQCKLELIGEDNTFLGYGHSPDEVFHDSRITANEQYQLFLRTDPIEALGMFKKTDVVKKDDLYDVEFRDQEDTPFALRMLKKGHKVWYIDEPLVQRRMRRGSLSGLSDARIVSKNNLIRIRIGQKYVEPEVSGIERFYCRYNAFFTNLFYNTFLNKKNKLNQLLWRIVRYPSNNYNKRTVLQLKNEIKNRWK